jgi:hypothetical protein
MGRNYTMDQYRRDLAALELRRSQPAKFSHLRAKDVAPELVAHGCPAVELEGDEPWPWPSEPSGSIPWSSAVAVGLGPRPAARSPR